MFRRGKKDERSGSGSPIYRHEAAQHGFVPPAEGDPAIRDALDRHLEAHLGPCDTVWHELVSDLVHLDVYMWRPTAERPMYTFVTMGMSDRPMTLPPEARAAGSADRAELMLCLPPTWPVPADVYSTAPWQDEAAYFPIRGLKQLGRLPHEYDTWLGFGHTIPNGDPPAPFTPRTRLSGWLLLSPLTLPNTFHRVDLPGGGQARIFSLVALLPEEMDRKLAQGVDSLFDGFEAHEVTEILDTSRGSSLLD